MLDVIKKTGATSLLILAIFLHTTALPAQSQDDGSILSDKNIQTEASDEDSPILEASAAEPDADSIDPESPADSSPLPAAEAESGTPVDKPSGEVNPLDPVSEINLDADGGELLQRGENLLEYGDYPSMVKMLEQALAMEKFQGEQLLRVHRLLGIGYFILHNKSKSGEHFLRLLTQAPDTQLDPLYVPPIIIDYFKKIREDNKSMLDAILAKQQEVPEKLPTAMAVKRYNPYFVNFIPFGAGQFQNEQPTKGALFLSSEVLTLGFNIAGYFATLGLQSGDGYYSAGNAERAREWRIVQYVSLGALAALMVGGIIDAVLNHKEYTILSIEEIDAEEKSNEPEENGPQPEGSETRY